jgi:hypothetical protein
MAKSVCGIIVLAGLFVAARWYIATRLAGNGYLSPAGSHSDAGVYILAAYGAAGLGHLWLLADLWLARDRIFSLPWWNVSIDLLVFVGIAIFYIPTQAWQIIAAF